MTDYLTANDPALSTPLTEDQRSSLYAELASGAETGWDYSSRWLKDPLAGSASDQNPKLRSLNVRSTLPICLNSILCMSLFLNSIDSSDTKVPQTRRIFCSQIFTITRSLTRHPLLLTVLLPSLSALVSLISSGTRRSLPSTTST